MGIANNHYLGTVYISTKNLLYDGSDDECTGCCASDEEHHLPALISTETLAAVLSTTGLQEKQLYQIEAYPVLQLPTETLLRCLHGAFRLQHANRDAQHAVDLYTSDITHSIETQIRQLYRSHPPPSDGEIYLKLRFFQRKGDRKRAATWLSKWSKSKQKLFHQVQRLEWLSAALDRLDRFPALWEEFCLGPFGPILSWRCYEEVEFYLETMHQIWEDIGGGRDHWCDALTIQLLGGLAPRWCQHDHEKVLELVSCGKILRRSSNASLRLNSILRTKGSVLTFATFFKYSKLLGSTMVTLRALFPDPLRPSVRSAVRDAHVRPETAMTTVWRSETETTTIHLTREEHFQACYWELCLSAIRSLDDTNWFAAKRQIAGIERPGWLINLASRSYQLGFRSNTIDELRELDGNLCDIRIHMRQEKPPCNYNVPEPRFFSEASRRLGLWQQYAKQKPSIQPRISSPDGSDACSNTHKLLYLGAIWAASMESSDQILTPFGRLLLSIAAFHGRVGVHLLTVPTLFQQVLLQQTPPQQTSPRPQHQALLSQQQASPRSQHQALSQQQQASQVPPQPQQNLYQDELNLWEIEADGQRCLEHSLALNQVLIEKTLSYIRPGNTFCTLHRDLLCKLDPSTDFYALLTANPSIRDIYFFPQKFESKWLGKNPVWYAEPKESKRRKVGRSI